MRFEDSKKLKAIELLKLLQEAVKKNADKIKLYNMKARMIIEGKTSPDNQTENIKSLSERMSMLTAENKRHIELHNNLLNFLNSLKSDDESQVSFIDNHEDLNDCIAQPECENQDDCLEKTISGLIPFNSNHPLFNDKAFKDRLMQYYIDQEDYEKCDQLSRM